MFPLHVSSPISLPLSHTFFALSSTRFTALTQDCIIFLLSQSLSISPPEPVSEFAMIHAMVRAEEEEAISDFVFGF